MFMDVHQVVAIQIKGLGFEGLVDSLGDLVESAFAEESRSVGSATRVVETLLIYLLVQVLVACSGALIPTVRYELAIGVLDSTVTGNRLVGRNLDAQPA